ncbi:hypothetical protein V2G26_012260 [Clonostachys chloroleuca]
MAKIYARASCVIVWLGGVADRSNEALEAIRAAAEGQSVKSATDQAILTLLERPWFKRIWVLQEVAAARHILIKSGRTEIDGFAFCSGLSALKISYGTNQSLGNIIPTMAYLIRGAVFRPRYEGHETSQLGRFALNIRPLSQLVDTFHTRQATDPRDKIYALLGMSSDDSDDLDNAGLSPNYQMPWKEVFRNLVKFSTSDQMSVTVWDDKEVAIIKGKGCILGQVSQVKSHDTRHDIQSVEFLWKKPFYQKGNLVSKLTFPTSAKPVQAGDAVYFLQGAPMPSIVRLCHGHLAVIVIAIPLPDYTQPITAPRCEIPVVWDWETSQSKAQDEAYHKGLIASCREPKCPSTECKCQDYLHEATKLWDSGLILNGLERYDEAGKTLQKAVKIYGAALKTAIASHGPWTNSDNEALSVMNDIIIREQGADTEPRDKERRTPLSRAAESGHESFVRLLLDMGSDVDAKDDDGKIPLFHAVDNRCEAITRLLLDKGATIDTGDRWGTTLVSQAAVKGQEAIIRLLLDRGAAVDSRDYRWGRTPLSQAAANGHETVVRLLLDIGADIDAKDDDGRTPLYHAIDNRREIITQLLLDKGANINAPDQWGETPLSQAAANGHETVVRLLLDIGADIDAKDDNGRTPLCHAVNNGREVIVRLLLHKGATIDARDRSGQTPLSWAAADGHETVVRLLLDRGAAVDAWNDFGWTPLLYASANGHETVVRLLLDKGAAIDARGGLGWTPLLYASANGHETVVRLLLDKGATNDAWDGSGRTPLWWATRNGHEAVVQLLLDKGADIDVKMSFEVE